MKNLIPAIEAELGPDRLARLRRDPDAYQQFWLGVLEAMARVDWTRESLAFLISNGFGAVRNMRRTERSWTTMKTCPSCGAVVGFRAIECKKCGVELKAEPRLSQFEDWGYESREHHDVEMTMIIKDFVDTLQNKDRYVARRWMLDRADLLYQNHTKQLAAELGVSAPRVAQIKARVRKQFLAWYNRE